MKKFIYIFALSLLSILTSCDNCNSVDNCCGDDFEYDYYITELNVSQNNTSIFKLSPSTNSYEKLIENATIFSPPSNDNNLVFIHSIDGIPSLCSYNIVTKSLKVLEKETPLFSLSYPIISSDGKNIAFYGGSNKLFIYNIQDKAIDKISSNCINNFGFYFSPNSNYLAIIEEISSNKILKVIDVNNFDNVLLQVDITEFSACSESNQLFKWNENSNKIIFCGKTNDEYKVMIYSIDGTNKDFIISNNLGLKNASLSIDEKCLAIISNKGEVWIRSLDSEYPILTQIVAVAENEQVKDVMWIDKSNSIAYTKSVSIFENNYNLLYNMSIEYNNSKAYVTNYNLVANNVYNAFWK